MLLSKLKSIGVTLILSAVCALAFTPTLTQACGKGKCHCSQQKQACKTKDCKGGCKTEAHKTV